MSELCSYTTVDRDRIHYHHIIPKSMNGSNKAVNRLYLCPTCHTKIWFDGSKGIHGIRGNNPIVIISKKLSTGGVLIEYTINDETRYSLLKNSYL